MIKQINFIIKNFINNKPLKRIEIELEIKFLKSFIFSKKKIKAIIYKNFKFLNFKHLFIRSMIYKFGGGSINCLCIFYKYDHLKLTIEAKHKLMKEKSTKPVHKVGKEKSTKPAHKVGKEKSTKRVHRIGKDNLIKRLDSLGLHSLGYQKRQILKEKRKKLTKFRGIIKLKN
uniref:Ribosomal protein S24 n=1 Tax=Lotharella vacuolata TaxID=74820 RepID=A0A0H5BH88_9EUKA|nr:ribosomal protein S24 [Lotharella vacuolata]